MHNSKLITHNSKLVLLVVAFVVLATVYSLVMPLGEGPDEPGHAHYVFFLAKAGRLPVQSTTAGKSDVPGEGHQPPLAYALMVPLVAWLPADARQFDLPANARFTWAGGSELNAVAHGSQEYLPWRGFVLAWHLARLGAVALGAATVVFTYLAARAINCRLQIADCRLEANQSAIPLLAAALVAFNPQFLFVSALVTNDALLVTLSAALLWLAVRRPTTDDRRPTIGATIRYAILVGFVLGLALITKQSAIILVPVAFLAVLAQSRSVTLSTQQRRSVTPSPRHLVTLSSCHLVILSALLAFVITTLLVSGWWYARNARLYGDIFGLAVFQAEFATQPFVASSLAAWVGALAQLHSSFWARFGWMNVPPPDWVIWFFTIVEIIGLAGLIRRWVKDKRRTTNDEGRFFRPWSSVLRLWRCWPLLALPALALVWVISFALTTGLVAWQGRLLFPALPALAILLAWGLAAWRNKEPRTENKSGSYALFFVLCPLFLISLWLPFGVIRPAYPFHTLPEARALVQLGTPVYGRFMTAGELGAELRGWRIDGPARPGDTPALTLMWLARSRQNRNWTVFIHLVDDQEQIVAQDNHPPQDGAFPMRQWVAGDWVEDRHMLALPASLAPGTYHLRVGLYDPRTERRAGVYSQRNKLQGDFVDLGTIVIGS